MKATHLPACLTCLVLWLLCPPASQAQTFRASHLQRASQQLRLGPALSALSGTAEQTITAPDGQTLTARRGTDGVVEHIGWPLFSDEMRLLLPSPIYDYLEYALLDNKYHLSDNTLAYDKVHFDRGGWRDLEQVTPSDECTIRSIDDKHYLVSWSRNGSSLMKVTFPIDYELLANSTRREMEANFLRDLLRHWPEAPQPLIVEPEDLLAGRDDILVRPGDTFLIPEINANTYYRLTITSEKVDTITYEEELPVILADSRYPAETLANLLLVPEAMSRDADLQLTLLLYGYRQEQVRVSLRQWLSFCRAAGCTPYYIYEGADGQTLSAILIMHNRQEGYAHMLYLHCPSGSLELQVPQMEGKAFLYIPTSNISDLFASETAGKSTPKKFE